MRNFLLGIQLLSGALIIVLILLQKEGVGLGAAFGGEGNFYRKRRGAERFIFSTTVVLSVIFVMSSFAFSIIK